MKKIIQYDDKLANELFESVKKYVVVNKQKDSEKYNVYLQAPFFLNAITSLDDNDFGLNETPDVYGLISDNFIRLSWDEHIVDARMIEASLVDLISDIIQYEIKAREEDKK